MSYFPMFYSLNNKKILLIGAGKIASKKLEKLLDFTENISIIALDIDESILEKTKKYNLNIIKKSYEKADIKGFDIVISTVDDLSLQKSIYFECKEEKILYNCVDLQECCDFLFPSYIKDGDLTIAISTNGSSPSFSKSLKKYFKDLLPSDVSIFLSKMRVLRSKMPKGKERMIFLDKKVKEYMKSWN